MAQTSQCPVSSSLTVVYPVFGLVTPPPSLECWKVLVDLASRPFELCSVSMLTVASEDILWNLLLVHSTKPVMTLDLFVRFFF